MKTPCEVLDNSGESDCQPFRYEPTGPGFFRSHWGGGQPLLSAFWGVGLLGTLATLFVTFSLGLVLASNTLALFGHIKPWVPLALVWAPYLAFVWVSVWRCAPNTGNQLWTYLARACVVLYVLAAVRLATMAIQMS